MIPLSVLDLATVASGSTPADALRDTTAMASGRRGLGYRPLLGRRAPRDGGRGQFRARRR